MTNLLFLDSTSYLCFYFITNVSYKLKKKNPDTILENTQKFLISGKNERKVFNYSDSINYSCAIKKKSMLNFK